MDFATCLKTHTAPLDDLERLAKAYRMTGITIIEEPSLGLGFKDPLNPTLGFYKIRCDFPTDSKMICVRPEMSLTVVLQLLEQVSDEYYKHGPLGSKTIAISRAYPSVDAALSAIDIGPVAYKRDIDFDILDVFTKLFAFSKTSWKVYYQNPKTIVIESERGKFRFDIDRFIDVLIGLNVFEAME